MMVKGSFEHVWVQGENQLAFATTVQRGQKMAREVPGVRIIQNGDDGVNAAFPLDRFSEVAKRLKLYRKRKVSPEQAAAMKERLRQWQFKLGAR